MAARKPRKVYLAGSCGKESRQMLKSIQGALIKAGYDVYAPFDLQIPNAYSYPQEEWSMMVFEADIKAIDSCDIFLMISAGRSSTAGTNFEEGYAFAKKKKIIVVQYTLDDTSLMTYGGATVFRNSTLETLIRDIIAVMVKKEFLPKKRNVNGRELYTEIYTHLT